MNTETGELIEFDNDDALKSAMNELNTKHDELLVAVEENDMTKKQKKNMQVSKYDNKSKLGKKFKTARAKRKWMAKQIKNQNKK